ncbi:hypothetical protein SUGI_0233390 [Cryptomeria japonica]|nr:hypothetical protein SUGI_0233390 [Cryptomeria japonica]
MRRRRLGFQETFRQDDRVDLQAERKDNGGEFMGELLELSEDVEEDIDLWKKLAIICRFVGRRSGRSIIKKWVSEKWSSQSVIKFIPKGVFVVIFAEEEARKKVLFQQNWFLDGIPLYLQPWQSNFDPVPLGVYNNPIWTRLYNLPIAYWDESCLEKIGRSLGTLLAIDEQIVESDSYIYARLKLAAVKHITTKIWF